MAAGDFRSEARCTAHLRGAPEIGNVVFAGLLASDVQGIISQWGEQLMSEEAACKEAKEKLPNNYSELLSCVSVLD